jgi:hypothetical protein
MTQNSTATGLFALTGSLSATINGATYTDLFSGFATFNGSYNTDPRPFTNAPQLMEQYTFSATAPEPATWAVMLVGLGILGISRVNGRP